VTTILVTGANQGLGLAVVEGLARRLDSRADVYLTGRNPDRVRAAADRLEREGSPVRTAVLDVRDTDAVEALAAQLAERHGGIDVVVSNAAARITPERPAAEQVEAFVDTNNLGTTRMIRAFGPALAPGGRFLVVASDFGTLRSLPQHLHERFDAERLTLDELDRTMIGYAEAVRTGHAAAEGWPDHINLPSKVGQVAAARVFAREARSNEEDGRLIAAVCPGLIDTDASRPWFEDMSGAQSPEQAAVDVVELAVDRADPAHYGQLVQHGRVIPWK
jgi:carbonyl reductase 1